MLFETVPVPGGNRNGFCPICEALSNGEAEPRLLLEWCVQTDNGVLYFETCNGCYWEVLKGKSDEWDRDQAFAACSALLNAFIKCKPISDE
ncbi:hypothetical protein [Botrimarina mediterranea]|uniref:hypothetical protein n=1 Tax=Botrimarina mediterranea TaxID=2528022 RepID=UPI0011877856|nr:hypothetical protein K2D_12850 [Planctomycetes bacterium K2D]